MSPFDIKQLYRQNRGLHDRHLRELKRSVAARHYHVSSNKVASSILREAMSGNRR